TEQAAALVDHRGPGLISPLDAEARLGEVSGERQRDADRDRVLTPLALAVPVPSGIGIGGVTGACCERERGDAGKRSPSCERLPRHPSSFIGSGQQRESAFDTLCRAQSTTQGSKRTNLVTI